jgi:hypothetical protein
MRLARPAREPTMFLDDDNFSQTFQVQQPNFVQQSISRTFSRSGDIVDKFGRSLHHDLADPLKGHR